MTRVCQASSRDLGHPVVNAPFLKRKGRIVILGNFAYPKARIGHLIESEDLGATCK